MAHSRGGEEKETVSGRLKMSSRQEARGETQISTKDCQEQRSRAVGKALDAGEEKTGVPNLTGDVARGRQ